MPCCACATRLPCMLGHQQPPPPPPGKAAPPRTHPALGGGKGGGGEGTGTPRAPAPRACGPGAASPCDPTCAEDDQGPEPRAPGTQQPCPGRAHARAYTQDDGIFRPPALRWGLVAVDSPLGLGTGQSSSSASWWGREGRPRPRACSCMRLPAQPNPTQPNPKKAVLGGAQGHNKKIIQG